MVVSDTLNVGVRFNVHLGFLHPSVNSILSGGRIEEERYNRRVGAFSHKKMH